MPIDGICVFALQNELRQKLVGGKITKLYQPESDEVRISVRNGGQEHKLLISASSSTPRIHLTETQKENPMSPPMFCMLLRKNLTSGRIIDISQHGFERIIDISIESYNELQDLTVKHIICEIMGKHSNIILVSEGKIIDSIKHVDLTVSRVRMVLPGLPYTPPPPQNKLDLLGCSYEDIVEVFEKAGPNPEKPEKIVLNSFLGTSPLFSREIIHLAETSGEPAKELHSLTQKINRLEFENILLYHKEQKGYLEFACYPVKQYGDMVEVVSRPTISEVIDEFYRSRDNQARLKQRSASLQKLVSNLLERALKKQALQNQILLDSQQRDAYRINGDLLIACRRPVPPGASRALVEDYYNNNELVEIPIDPALSLQKNAQKYYKRYQKAKVAQVKATEQLEKNKLEIEYLESVLFSIESAANNQALIEIKEELTAEGYVKNINRSKAKQPKTPPILPEAVVDGYDIYVGKNNRQNDYITLKLGRATDIWLHIKDLPGAHVLIKTKEQNVPHHVLEKAAELAAVHSKNKLQATALVDYTQVKNVKKPRGAKPGMVIYVAYKTIRVKQ